MSKALTVRGVRLGEGMPKIIVPIVGKSYTDIIGKAESFADKKIGMVEWRADFFEDIFDTERVLYTVSALRDILAETPLLFTFRSKKEGGEKNMDLAAYTALNIAVAQSGKADLVDVEIASGDAAFMKNIAGIHAAGAFAIGSDHDFLATPPAAELVARMRKIQDMKADIIKLAVMPTSTADVLALLAATTEMCEKYADRPIITVSMSGLGIISRLAGECFGSAATFGTVGQGSAPGQIPVEQLAQVMDIIHSS